MSGTRGAPGVPRPGSVPEAGEAGSPPPAGPAGHAKRPYTRPVLTVHGSLVRVTRGGNVGDPDETIYTTTASGA